MNRLATVVSGVNFYSPFPRIREDGNIIPIHARNDCCLNKYRTWQFFFPLFHSPELIILAYLFI